jgi:nucleotide-binding universal stress UspA family protein
MKQSWSQQPSRVIWAVDAFEATNQIHYNCAAVLRFFKERFKSQINPVCVLSASQLNLPGERAGRWIHHYQPAIEKEIQTVLKEVHLDEQVETPEILLQRSTSTTEAVNLLSQFALSRDADLIVVGTHGRSGMERFLLGSFTETLLLRSEVPVLVIGQTLQEFKNIDRIFFPTEFGPHSKFIFRQVVRMAAEMKAKLTLFHYIPHPIEPVFQSGIYLLGGSWIPVQAFFGDEVNKKTKRIGLWTKWANQQGVETDSLIHSEGGVISDVILSEAERRKMNCIVMEAQSGPISAALVGSITRQVIRSAACPVWVVRHGMQKALAFPSASSQDKKQAA